MLFICMYPGMGRELFLSCKNGMTKATFITVSSTCNEKHVFQSKNHMSFNNLGSSGEDEQLISGNSNLLCNKISSNRRSLDVSFSSCT